MMVGPAVQMFIVLIMAVALAVMANRLGSLRHRLWEANDTILRLQMHNAQLDATVQEYKRAAQGPKVGTPTEPAPEPGHVIEGTWHHTQ